MIVAVARTRRNDSQCSSCTGTQEQHREVIEKRVIRQLKTSQHAILNWNTKFVNIFSPDQRLVLQTSSGTNRECKWSAQIVQKSLQVLFFVWSIGIQIFILSQEYPLPATPTLHKSLEGICFDCELLKEVFELL